MRHLQVGYVQRGSYCLSLGDETFLQSSKLLLPDERPS